MKNLNTFWFLKNSAIVAFLHFLQLIGQLQCFEKLRRLIDQISFDELLISFFVYVVIDEIVIHFKAGHCFSNLIAVMLRADDKQLIDEVLDSLSV